MTRRQTTSGHNRLADIKCEVIGETTNAYRIDVDGKKVWVPKSQCEWDEDSSVITMPEWLAVDKELV